MPSAIADGPAVGAEVVAKVLYIEWAYAMTVFTCFDIDARPYVRLSVATWLVAGKLVNELRTVDIDNAVLLTRFMFALMALNDSAPVVGRVLMRFIAVLTFWVYVKNTQLYRGCAP